VGIGVELRVKAEIVVEKESCGKRIGRDDGCIAVESVRE